MNYKIHVSGTVTDPETGFGCGFDISVTNGGSIENVGAALQQSINQMSSAAVATPKEQPEAPVKE